MAKLTRRVATAWAAVGAALLVWTGLAAGVGAGEKSKYHDDLRGFQKQEHFWSVVAGKADPRPGVLDKLAQDMHDLSRDQVYKFRGDSNRYGGITDELGYDPFNGENCHECGPLRQSFADSVIDVKNGNVAAVIGAPPAKSDGGTGPPFFAWVLWLFSLPAAWIYAKRRGERRYASVPHEARLIRELDAAMKELPAGSPQYDDLAKLKTNLQGAVDKRVDYGEDERDTLRLENLKQEASDALDAVTEGNRALQ